MSVLFKPTLYMINKSLSFLEEAQYTFQAKKAAYTGFINFSSQPQISFKKFKKQGKYTILSIVSMDMADQAEVNEIQYFTVFGVLSAFGGLYTAIVNPIVFLLSPFLYRSFMKEVNHMLKKNEAGCSSTLIKRQIKERVSFSGVY